MNLPDTCPFCGSFAELRNGEKWVGYTCITTIHAGHDARRMQSITCAGFERTRLLARVAEMEAENSMLRAKMGGCSMSPGNGEHRPRDPRQLGGLDTYPVAQVEALVNRIDELEAENKSLRDRFSDADTERNAAQAALKAAFDRVAELEARCKRLEEAARAVYLDSIASDHPWTELETRNMHALRDVLEAKP